MVATLHALPWPVLLIYLIFAIYLFFLPYYLPQLCVRIVLNLWHQKPNFLTRKMRLVLVRDSNIWNRSLSPGTILGGSRHKFDQNSNAPQSQKLCIIHLNSLTWWCLKSFVKKNDQNLVYQLPEVERFLFLRVPFLWFVGRPWYVSRVCRASVLRNAR